MKTILWVSNVDVAGDDPKSTSPTLPATQHGYCFHSPNRNT